MFKEVTPLFPTPLYVAQDDDMPNVLDSLSDLERSPYGYANGGERTDSTNIIDEIPQELSEWIYSHIKEYAYGVQGISTEHHIQIPNSWINFMHKDDRAHPHDHCNSIYSGIVFLSAPTGSAELIFEKNKYKTIEPTIAEYNLYNSHIYRITPQDGMICIFPSDLVHYVDVHTLDQPRISLAFNIFIRGEFGMHTKRLNLK